MRSLYLITLLSFLSLLNAAEPLVVHEWGTFTVFQDEEGNEIPGVNVDDEPVPSFVHRLHQQAEFRGDIMTPVQAVGRLQNPIRLNKSVPYSLPAVSMRMETPVIYFYPENKDPFLVDVDVRFNGGWISEWYPRATGLEAPGFSDATLSQSDQGRVFWKDVQVNARGALVETNDPVWLAPRQVDAATLATGKEREKYIYYRGVAAQKSLIRVQQKRSELSVHMQEDGPRLTIPDLWLIDVDKRGHMALRSTLMHGNSVELQSEFEESDYGLENHERLHQLMKTALIKDGLFPKEAEAMLQTWKISYFKSVGKRLFYLLPRQWTDAVLPLTITSAAHDQVNVIRSMVGRIELLTERQDEALKIVAGPAPIDLTWHHKGLEKLNDKRRVQLMNAAQHGVTSMLLEEYGFEAPAAYTAYLDLGRFRDALLFREGMKCAPFVAYLDQLCMWSPGLKLIK